MLSVEQFMSLASSEDEDAVPIKTERHTTRVSGHKRMAGRKRKAIQLGSDSERSSGSDEPQEDLPQGSIEVDSGDGDSDCSEDSNAESSDGGDSEEEDMGTIEPRPFEVTSWKKARKVRKSVHVWGDCQLGDWAGCWCTPARAGLKEASL